jgi:hypothetical protein
MQFGNWGENFFCEKMQYQILKIFCWGVLLLLPPTSFGGTGVVLFCQPHPGASLYRPDATPYYIGAGLLTFLLLEMVAKGLTIWKRYAILFLSVGAYPSNKQKRDMTQYFFFLAIVSAFAVKIVSMF